MWKCKEITGDPRECANTPGAGPRDCTPWPLPPYHARATPPGRRAAGQPGDLRLIADLEATRWTGRPGYPLRAMVGLALVKSMYTLPTWTRPSRWSRITPRCGRLGGAPSHGPCYRFAAKLREHGDMLTACIDRVLAALHGTRRWARRSPLTGPTFPPTPTATSTSVTRMARCAPGSPTRTPGGVTGRLFPPARAARITATRFSRGLHRDGAAARVDGQAANEPERAGAGLLDTLARLRPRRRRA